MRIVWEFQANKQEKLSTTAFANPNLMFTSVEDEATEIAVLARSRLPQMLRQLGAAVTAPSERRSRDLWWRIRRGVFGRDEAAEQKAAIDAASLEVATLADELQLKIEQFLNLASFAGSPPAYQQDLRESRLTLGQLLLNAGDGKGELDLDTFKTLSNIVDLVELTRRDVQRRMIDDPAIGATFVTAHFPADQPEAAEEILGIALDDLDSKTSLSSGAADRVRLVAQLVYDLRFSHTPEGLLDWFHQPFPELDDRTPIDILEDSEYEQRLRSYARSLRTQVAT